MICVVFTIHQTSPTTDSRLNSGGPPNLGDLVKRKVPVERKMGAANFHSFTHDCTLVLYKQLIQTGSVLLLLLLSSVLGFPPYQDTADKKATTHQLYSQANGLYHY